MDEIFIKADYLNPWIIKHLPKKDLISIDDLIGAIEDMDGEIDNLEQKIKDIKNDIEENYKYKW